MKALILFGTRNGFTGKTAKVIEEVLINKGYSVDVFENKVLKNKIKELDTYNIVIAGSSIMAGLWKRGVKSFLKKNGKNIKNLYLFATAAGVLNSVDTGTRTKEEAVKIATERYITPLVSKYSLKLKGSTVLGGQFGKGDKIKYNNWNEKDIREFAEKID
ncbi:MAG: flavodoxin domain-containing protein [Bacillota bacterium]|nr:flavodoxin domain-containing protein [Bacillota bacterium]